MSEELDTTQAEPSEEDELSTTPPNPAIEPEEDGSGGWKMPKPVFRKTSGYLPQGFAEKYPQAGVGENGDEVNPAASTEEEPVSVVNVEPQPDIHESHPGFEVPAASVKPEKKGGAAKLFFTILGLLVALFLVVAFIALIYFLFFSPSNDTTF